MTAPSLSTHARRALEKLKTLSPHLSFTNDRPLRLLLAVSGGSDSIALVHVLHLLKKQYPLFLHAHGINHGLRAEAHDELMLAKNFCESLGIPFSYTRISLPPGGNLQARARDKRYEILQEVKTNLQADFLVTAHHANDKAETVLLRLLRGSQVDGLAVLPLLSKDIFRPFLSAPKERIWDHVKRNNLPYAEDPSNQNTDFLRIKVRKEVLPLLLEINPNMVLHLCKMADELQLRNQETSEAVRETREPWKTVLLEQGIDPHALSERTRLALTELPLKSKKAEVLLPKGLVARWNRDHLVFTIHSREQREKKLKKTAPP